MADGGQTFEDLDKLFKKALPLLRHVIDNENDGEQSNSVLAFLRIWNKKADPTDISEFWQWLEQGNDFNNDPEEVRVFLAQGADKLAKQQASNVFSKGYDDYIEAINAQAANNEHTAIMNDICVMLDAAEKEHAAGQAEASRTFKDQATAIMDEYGIDKDTLREHRQKRQAAMLDLFKKADVLAKTKAPTIRAKLEEDFGELAIEFGFLDQDAGATTDEFDAEYEAYCLDREAYMKAKGRPQTPKDSQPSGNQSASADDDGEPDASEPFEDPLAPEPPEPEPITHINTFPIRDAEGTLSAFVHAANYTEALHDFIGGHAPTKSISLSLDFATEAISHETEIVTVNQHSAIEGWNFNASDNIAWVGSSPEATVANTTFKAKSGSITVGSAQSLKVELADGSFKALTKIEEGDIALKKGTANVAGAIAGGSYTLSDGSLIVGGDVTDAKIEVNGADNKFEAKRAVAGTEIKIGEKSRAEFRKDITGGSVEATSNVAFMNKAANARGTTFDGHIPSSPNLSISDFQRENNANNMLLAQKLASQMPRFFYEALGLGRPETITPKKRYKSPLFQRTRVIELRYAETSFIKDLMFGLNNGLETPLITVAGTKAEQKRNMLEVQQFLERNPNGRLVVFPIFPDKQQATIASRSATKIDGPFHYRFAFVTDHKGYLRLNGQSFFADNCDENGYPKEFWREFGSALFLDISAPNAFSQEPDCEAQASAKIARKVINSSWAQEKKDLFSYSKSQRLDECDPEFLAGEVKTPFRLSGYYSDESSSTPENTRPNYKKSLKELIEACRDIEKDWEAIPVLGADVFKACTFRGLSTDIYTGNLEGITLSGYNGTVYTGGSLSQSSLIDSSVARLLAVSDVDMTSASISNKSVVSIEPFNATTLTLNANSINVTDASLEVSLTADSAAELRCMKAQKANIKITKADHVDFSDAEFEDCKITVSSVNQVAFNNTSFKNCKIKVESETVDFSEVSIGGRGNTLSLTTKTAVFKGASIGGKTKITGQADIANFEGASLGDSVLTSQDKVSYELRSSQNKYDATEFGNVVFLSSETDTDNTDWQTVKITGLVSASGEMAQVLYPLFGKAANMDEETAPGPKAGNAAHPSRRFALD